MPRNFNCNCLCHGQDGNVTDAYFCCKNCYAANHMGNLPRQSWEDTQKPKSKGKKDHKPRAPKRPTGTVETVANATMVVAERTATEKRFDLGHRLEKKDGKPIHPQSSN
jgi:hypothetical protein